MAQKTADDDTQIEDNGITEVDHSPRMSTSGFPEGFLSIPWKKQYIFSKKSNTCIFCDIINGKVPGDIIFKDKHLMVILNKFPYNSGHLLVIPIKHVECIESLDDNELLLLIKAVKTSVEILKDAYNPQGFNIGINQGSFSGASVKHLHFHIVPRYKNETGFMDTVSGTRVLLEDLNETLRKLKKYSDRFERSYGN